MEAPSPRKRQKRLEPIEKAVADIRLSNDGSKDDYCLQSLKELHEYMYPENEQLKEFRPDIFNLSFGSGGVEVTVCAIKSYFSNEEIVFYGIEILDFFTSQLTKSPVSEISNWVFTRRHASMIQAGVREIVISIIDDYINNETIISRALSVIEGLMIPESNTHYFDNLGLEQRLVSIMRKFDGAHGGIGAQVCSLISTFCHNNNRRRVSFAALGAIDLVYNAIVDYFGEKNEEDLIWALTAAESLLGSRSMLLNWENRDSFLEKGICTLLDHIRNSEAKSENDILQLVCSETPRENEQF